MHASVPLIVRPPRIRDLDRLFAIYGDPATQRFNPAGPLADRGQAQALLDHWLAHWERHGYGWWAIAEAQAPGEVIGFGGIALHPYLDELRVNLGYRFAVQAWGKGHATQLGRQALAQGFDVLRLPRIHGFVRPDHAASIRVLEKIGMQPVGTLDDVPGQAPSLVFEAVSGAAR